MNKTHESNLAPKLILSGRTLPPISLTSTSYSSKKNIKVHPKQLLLPQKDYVSERSDFDSLNQRSPHIVVDSEELVAVPPTLRTQSEEMPNKALMSNVAIKFARSADQQQLKNEDASSVSVVQDIDQQEKQERMKKFHGFKPRMHYIANFMSKMKRLSTIYLFRSLKRRDLRYINDQAADSEYFFIRNYFTNEVPSSLQSFWFRLKQLNSYRYAYRKFIIGYGLEGLLIIMPNQLFNLIWNFFILSVLTLNVIYVPLKNSFELTPSNFTAIVMDDIPNWAFVIEIVLNFNTAFYSKGLIVIDRELIIAHYLHTRFFWDLAIVVTYYSGKYTNTPFIDLVLILRYFDIMHIYKNLEERFRIRQRMGGAADLIKLVAQIIFLAHFLSCMFHGLAILEIYAGEQDTWLGALVDDSWESRYVSSLYWACVTMTTIGYGDIVPHTLAEKLFVTAVALLSSFVFAYSMSSIGEIFKGIGKQEIHFQEQMQQLNVYMENRGLNSDLQMRVRKYFQYLHSEELENNEQAANLLHKLAHNLQEEVQRDVYGKLLHQHEVFRLNFSEGFLRELAVKVQEKRVNPEEHIYKQDDAPERLFFLLKGSVQLVALRDHKTEPIYLGELGKGSLLGEQGFFSGQAHKSTAISLNVSALAYILKSDFLMLLKDHPLDYEQYAMIRDKLLFYKDTRGIGSKCTCCQSFSHVINNCPLVNLRINNGKIIHLHKHSEMQMRNRLMRRFQSRSLTALKSMWHIVERAYDFSVVNKKTQNYLKQLDETRKLEGVQEEQDSMSSSNQSNSDDSEKIPRGYRQLEEFLFQGESEASPVHSNSSAASCTSDENVLRKSSSEIPYTICHSPSQPVALQSLSKKIRTSKQRIKASEKKNNQSLSLLLAVQQQDSAKQNSEKRRQIAERSSESDSSGSVSHLKRSLELEINSAKSPKTRHTTLKKGEADLLRKNSLKQEQNLPAKTLISINETFSKQQKVRQSNTLQENNYQKDQVKPEKMLRTQSLDQQPNLKNNNNMPALLADSTNYGERRQSLNKIPKPDIVSPQQHSSSILIIKEPQDTQNQEEIAIQPINNIIKVPDVAVYQKNSPPESSQILKSSSSSQDDSENDAHALLNGQLQMLDSKSIPKFQSQQPDQIKITPTSLVTTSLKLPNRLSNFNSGSPQNPSMMKSSMLASTRFFLEIRNTDENLLNNFERGEDFVRYFAHSNRSAVLQRYTQLQKLSETYLWITDKQKERKLEKQLQKNKHGSLSMRRSSIAFKNFKGMSLFSSAANRSTLSIAAPQNQENQ